MRSILRAYRSRRRWERLGVVAAIAVVGSAAVAIETTAASDAPIETTAASGDANEDRGRSVQVTTVTVPPPSTLDASTVTHRDEVAEMLLVSFEAAEAAEEADQAEGTDETEDPQPNEDADGADEPADGDGSDGQVPDAVWDELAQCESTSDWSINTGNGFYGGLQFELESWEWAGGHRYAEYPHHATREQQIEIAEELLEIHPAGWGAWPACAAQLGLR